MATLVADYVQKHGQLSQVAVSLADTNHNHCECPECVKQSPSDFYVMILNEIDDILTQRDNDTKIQMLPMWTACSQRKSKD